MRQSVLIGVLMVVVILFTSCSQNDNRIHVSPLGLDTNIGDNANPLQTIQAAINRAKAGETITIHGGIYREQLTIKSEKKGLKLIAFNNDKPVIKGSDIMTDWTPQDGYYKKYVVIQPQQVMVDGNNPLQQIGYPNDDFRDIQNYPRYEYPVGIDLKDMKEGRFYWSNNTLYIQLKDGSDPNKHQIEVSQRKYVIAVEADSVFIQGLAIQHSNANTFVEQGSAVDLGSYSTIKNCDVTWCDFGGISLGLYSVGAKVINCNTSYNGSTGINGAVSEDFLVSGCTSNHNNYRNFYAQWHTGGFKAASSAWGTIENSEFAYNIGAGVWFDYCYERAKYRTNGQKPIIIRNNYIHNNSPKSNKNQNAALMLEVTEMADVVNNLIINNGSRGIYISAAWNINIINNTITETHGYCAIDVAGMPREDGAHLTNVVIKNNIIYNNTSKYDIHLIQPLHDDVDEPVCDYNLIYRDNDKLSLWYSTDGRDGWEGETINNLKEWNKKTPFDKHSIAINPLFIDKILHTNSNSPVINAGDNNVSEFCKKDLDGNLRVVDGNIDLGVYEYQVEE